MPILNARFSGQPLTGVQRVAYELGRRLFELRGDVTALAPVPAFPEYNIPVEVAQSAFPALGGHIWEQSILRRRTTRDDILVNLGGTGPYGFRRQIVMIHDVNYLLGAEGYSWKFREWYRHLQSNLVRCAAICTVSQWSANEIARAFDIDADAITVIHNSADHIDAIVPGRGALDRYGISSRPYLLCVGSANPNKNFAAALDAFKAIPSPQFDLVIAGGGNPRIFRQDDRVEDNPRIHALPRVSDPELKAIMAGAAGFVMPSLLEGFGLPALEAMRVGTPVISSNAASLPEVCGDAALYFQPDNLRELTQAMLSLMEDPKLQSDLRKRGLARANAFSSDRSASKLSEMIDHEKARRT